MTELHNLYRSAKILFYPQVEYRSLLASSSSLNPEQSSTTVVYIYRVSLNEAFPEVYKYVYVFLFMCLWWGLTIYEEVSLMEVVHSHPHVYWMCTVDHIQDYYCLLNLC